MLACRSSRPRPRQASDAVEGMLAGPMQAWIDWVRLTAATRRMHVSAQAFAQRRQSTSGRTRTRPWVRPLHSGCSSGHCGCDDTQAAWARRWSRPLPQNCRPHRSALMGRDIGHLSPDTVTVPQCPYSTSVRSRGTDPEKEVVSSIRSVISLHINCKRAL